MAPEINWNISDDARENRNNLSGAKEHNNPRDMNNPCLFLFSLLRFISRSSTVFSRTDLCLVLSRNFCLASDMSSLPFLQASFKSCFFFWSFSICSPMMVNSSLIPFKDSPTDYFRSKNRSNGWFPVNFRSNLFPIYSKWTVNWLVSTKLTSTKLTLGRSSGWTHILLPVKLS